MKEMVVYPIVHHCNFCITGIFVNSYRKAGINLER